MYGYNILSAAEPVKNLKTTVMGHGRVQVGKSHHRTQTCHTRDPKTAGKPIPVKSLTNTHVQPYWSHIISPELMVEIAQYHFTTCVITLFFCN